MRSAARILCLLGLLVAGGCKTLDVNSIRPSWLGGKKLEYEVPARLAVIWSDALLNHPAAPTRGFGGRIYFYNKENQAVAVDGELVVYAYDDTGGIQKGRQPDRKFVFKAEQLTSYFSETQLGASYSIWVPWDRPGTGRRDVSLVPIFTAKNGVRIAGQPTKVTLPGQEGDPGFVRDVPIHRSTDTLHHGVRPAAHQDHPSPYSGRPGLGGQVHPAAFAGPGESQVRGADVSGPVDPAGEESPRSKATTIQLSPATARRLQASETPSRSLQKAMIAPQVPTGGTLLPGQMPTVPAAAPAGSLQHAVPYQGAATAPYGGGGATAPGFPGVSPPATSPQPLAHSGLHPGSAMEQRDIGSGPFSSSQIKTSATPRSQRPSAHSLPRRFQAPAGPIDRLSPDRFQR